ncbi:tail fiber domain-containing protein [Bdellovibrio bacteriovorus]|uniref:tail fiber domain-containing protein n=1 Tax=Bdellovibrio bacteriovorus TaxID=959 RepID=UPI0035A6E05F
MVVGNNANNGFSLVEILLALGILTIASLGTMTLMSDSFQSQRSLQSKNNQMQMIQDIETLLGIADVCKNNLGGTLAGSHININALPVTIPELSTSGKNGFGSPPGVIAYQTWNASNNVTYYGGDLKITRMRLNRFTAVADATGAWTNQGFADFEIAVERTTALPGGIGFNQDKSKVKLKLILENTYAPGVDNAVVACVSAGNGDSLWIQNPNLSIYYPGGNVGIATSAPRSALDVNGAVRLKAGIPTSKNAAVGLAFEDNGDTGLFMANYNPGTPTSGVLNVFTEGQPRMVIAANGNVGIGTTVPDYKLDVRANGLVISQVSSEDGDQVFFNVNSRIATGVPVGASMQSNAVDSYASFASTTSTNELRVASQSTSGIIRFIAGGSNPVNFERMRIDNSGNVGIGTQSPSRRLHVVGPVGSTVASFSDGAASCSIQPSAAGNISCSSDRRLKKNIEPVPDALSLEKILKLETVSYEWKHAAKGRHTGYIAQDVEKVAPELVKTADDGSKQVSYGGFIPWLSGAVKALYSYDLAQSRNIEELQIQIKNQNTEIQTLRKENQELQLRLERLEKAFQTQSAQ